MRQGPAATDLDSEQRRRVAPALRQLREQRRWTIAKAAQESGIQPSTLERYERGRTVPSKRVLNRLAHAYGVDLDYFLAFDKTSQQLNTELFNLLEQSGIPENTWEEFSRLSIQARTLLLHTLRRKCWSDIARREQIDAVEQLIITRGLQAAEPDIIDAIKRYGLSPMDFIRAQVQFEELPGERMIMIDRLPMAPAPEGMNQMHIFRATFGFEPAEPLVLKWWANTRRTAIEVNLQQFESRTIIPMSNLRRYILNGERAPGVVVSLDAVRRHVAHIVQLIRSNKHYRLGILETDPSINVRLKRSDVVLVASNYDAQDLRSGGVGSGLLFRHPEVTALFRKQFEQTWDALPDELKDPEAIADLLENMVLCAGQPSR